MQKFEIRYLRVDELKVHPTVQRESRDDWIDSLKENFDELGIGTMTAIEIDGDVLLIDGAHRHSVMVELEMLDYQIPVLVYFDLTIPEQIKVFKMLNTRRPVAQYDLYSLGLKEGNSIDVSIEMLTKKYDWVISKVPGESRICAISVLKHMVRSDPEATDYALRTITEIYGHHQDAGCKQLLQGFFNFYREHGNELDKQRARNRLLREYPTATVLKNKSYMFKMRNGSLYQAVVEAITRVVFG